MSRQNLGGSGDEVVVTKCLWEQSNNFEYSGCAEANIVVKMSSEKSDAIRAA